MNQDDWNDGFVVGVTAGLSATHREYSGGKMLIQGIPDWYINPSTLFPSEVSAFSTGLNNASAKVVTIPHLLNLTEI